jgi:hypothetical protein
MKYTVLLLILSLVCVGASYADEVNETIAISCDSLSGEMKIEAMFINLAHMEMNEVPVGYDLNLRSCKFLDDTKAKVELHEGVASARGQCGANPPIELQITRSDGKLLKFKFSPRCGGLLIKSAVLHRNYVKVCRYVEVSYKAPWVSETQTPEPKYECESY